MRHSKLIKMLALMLTLSLLLLAGACSKTEPTTAGKTDPPATQPPDSAATTPAPEKTDKPATEPSKAEEGGTILFGVTAPLTGENKMTGDYTKNGAELAQEQINAAGGILGKKLELVFEDEVNNLQASVNAMTKLANRPEVMGFFGSMYSGYVIGASPVTLEKKVTMMAGGSSANITKENNPYIWQVRLTDAYAGVLMAKAATENLKMTNPAILYSTESFGTGLMEQTVAAFEKMGITIEDSKKIGYENTEKNFAPLITNIQNSGADGLIAIGHQLPAATICIAVAAAGLEMPLLGSSSWGSTIVHDNAKDASLGWYAVADWTTEASAPGSKKFEEAYRAKYNAPSDLPAVTVYDSIMVFKKGCELANSTTDREAINAAMKDIKDLEGAMSVFSYHDNRSFSTSQFLTKNVEKDGKIIAEMIDLVKRVG